MTRTDQILIKLEFDRSIKYLSGRKDKLTAEECMQEIGALRLFIFNMGITKEGNKRS